MKNDGTVSRQTVFLDDIMKNLTWTDENGKKQKTLPLRDLRLFLPSQDKNKKSFESPLQYIHASPFNKVKRSTYTGTKICTPKNCNKL